MFGHISCPPAPISKIQAPADAEFQCAYLPLYAKIVNATFFGSKIHFFIFRLCVKEIFPLGFSFSSSVGTFQREREFFFSSKKIFFPGKLQLRTVQLKKTVSYNFFRTTCQKFRKIGSLGDSYGRGGSPPGGGTGGGGEKCLPHFPKFFFSPGDVKINLTVIPRDSRSVTPF